MNKAYLILRLDSVFSSFSSNRTERLISTSLFPTKSAIIGLLGCALGYPRGDKRLIELCDSLKMAVRIDKKPRKITDFQVIQAQRSIKQHGLLGEKEKDKDGNIRRDFLNALGFAGMIEQPSQGKVEGKKLVYKEYLTDSIFTVILEGSKNILEECLKGLENPVWMYTYGRNNCIPSVPIVGSEIPIREDFESLQEALEKVPIFERAKKYLRGKDNFLYELEVTDEEKKNYPVNTLIEVYDNTGEYVNYNYRKRYIYRGTVKVKNVSRDISVKEN